MSEKAKTRLSILWKLKFTMNENNSLVHSAGAEIAHYELETLEEEQFLKTVLFILQNSHV